MNPQFPFPDVDVLVVGAGPAGLATAILARLQGFRVMVADHSHPPIDKTCGEGLMPGTIDGLRALGVVLGTGEYRAFRGIRFVEASGGAVARRAQACFSGGIGAGVRRTILHAALVRRARELGVSLQWGMHLVVLPNGVVRGNGHRICSRWVVGADGLDSHVRRWVSPSLRVGRDRFGRRQHFQLSPWSEVVEVYWGRHCQIVVTPVGDNEVGIALISRSPNLRLADVLPDKSGDFAELAAHLAGAQAVSREQGAICGLQRFSRVYRDRFALLGDASGSVDPITGQGLGLAFEQAQALVDAMLVDRLEAYQEAYDGISRVTRRLSQLLLYLGDHARVRSWAMRVLALEPKLFDAFLNAPERILCFPELHFGGAFAQKRNAVSRMVSGVFTSPPAPDSQA